MRNEASEASLTFSSLIFGQYGTLRAKPVVGPVASDSFLKTAGMSGKSTMQLPP